MQKILGLDIGSYSIKAVVLLNEFSHYTVHAFAEERVVYSADSDEHSAQARALADLLERNVFEYDTAYAALDARHASVRRLEFENIRKRNISTFIKNELEGSIPFDLEEIVFDFQIISYTKQRTSVCTVWATKDNLQKLIGILEPANLKVRKIDVDSFAYLNLSTFLPPLPAVTPESAEALKTAPPRNCQLIVDIGYRKTTVTFLDTQLIHFTRVINMAGWYFTERIRQEFNLSFEDAESLKCNDMTAQKQLHVDKKLLAANLKKSIVELAQEIFRTIQTFLTTEDIGITHVYLTGGSSKLANVTKHFIEILEMPVSELTLEHPELIFSLRDDVMSPEQQHQGINQHAMMQALAIAMRSLPLKQGISNLNLRKGELSLTTDYNQLIKKIYFFAGVSAAIIACLLVSYSFRYFIYNNKINSIKTQFQKDLVTVFSSEPALLRSIAAKKYSDFGRYSDNALDLIIQRMQYKRSFNEIYNGGVPWVIDVLNQVSRAVPDNLYFEVSEFKIEDGNLYVSADTDKLGNVDKIMNSLASAKALSKIRKGAQDVKAGSNGKLIRFTFTARILTEQG